MALDTKVPMASIPEERLVELLNYQHLYHSETEKLKEQVRNQRDQLLSKEKTEQQLVDAINEIDNLKNQITKLKETIEGRIVLP